MLALQKKKEKKKNARRGRGHAMRREVRCLCGFVSCLSCVFAHSTTRIREVSRSGGVSTGKANNKLVDITNNGSDRSGPSRDAAGGGGKQKDKDARVTAALCLDDEVFWGPVTRKERRIAETLEQHCNADCAEDDRDDSGTGAGGGGRRCSAASGGDADTPDQAGGAACDATLAITAGAESDGASVAVGLVAPPSNIAGDQPDQGAAKTTLSAVDVSWISRSATIVPTYGLLGTGGLGIAVAVAGPW